MDGAMAEGTTHNPRSRPAFTLTELLVSLAIVALVVSILLPTLSVARNAARTTACALNLKQLGIAWTVYLDQYERFPRYTEMPDWNFGGVEFQGQARTPVLASDRPINSYIAEQANEGAGRYWQLYECPADRGVFNDLGPQGRAQTSILPDETVFETFGTSYRANGYLLDSSLTGIEPPDRPLRRQEIQGVPESRLLLTADAGWFYTTRHKGEPGDQYDASWHGKYGAGNMLAVDGSVRFIEFKPGETGEYLLYPRPGFDPSKSSSGDAIPPITPSPF
jgi:prepilin-type N-terminal cleavage/methylation domain-containing protein